LIQPPASRKTSRPSRRARSGWQPSEASAAKIVSRWAAQVKFDPQNKDALWGAYGYTPDKDVVRVPMKVDTLPFDVDELISGVQTLTRRQSSPWDVAFEPR
jgi:hypothetical protein